jgi:hypothetical protein
LVGVFIFVFVTFALALSHLISQNTAFNVIPFSIEEAKAIQHKTSSAPSLTEDNTIIPSSRSHHQPILPLLMVASVIIRPKEQLLSAAIV